MIRNVILFILFASKIAFCQEKMLQYQVHCVLNPINQTLFKAAITHVTCSSIAIAYLGNHLLFVKKTTTLKGHQRKIHFEYDHSACKDDWYQKHLPIYQKLNEEIEKGEEHLNKR